MTFSEAVTVTGTPSLTLDVGGESRALYTAGSGTRTLVFFHAVAEDDVDADGVSVPAGSISLRGGNIADAAGNAATLTHGALATDPARKVDGTIVPPAPYHIAFVGRAPHDADRRGGGDTYGTGDAIEVAVSFTRQVRVDTTGGVPSITLQVGKRDRVAAYVSIRDQYVLTFRYTVAAGDADTDGVSVRAGRIALNGATLAAVFGPTPALAHRRLVANPWRRVDAVAPTLEGIAMNDAPQEHEGHRTFFAGDVIRLTATFSEPVFVTGTPRVGLAIGAQSVNRHAEYVGMAGPSAPVFQYTVAAGDADADGLVTGGAVLVAGATVADAVGNAYLAAAAEGVAHRQRVDGSRSGSDNVGPVVQGLAFAGAAPYDADSNGTPETYRTGDAIEVAVTFNEAVTVDTSGGTPTLALEVGNAARPAAYVSGTGTVTLTFAYTVAPGDEDPNGVTVPPGSIVANGGTLADAAGNAATLAHGAITADSDRKVDGALTPAVVTGIAFTGAAPHDADRDGTRETYASGNAIRVAVTFSGAVTVDTSGGAPSVAVQVGDETVPAAYASGTGTATIVFAYRVAGAPRIRTGFRCRRVRLR